MLDYDYEFLFYVFEYKHRIGEQHIIWLFTLFCECIGFLQVLQLTVPKHAG